LCAAAARLYRRLEAPPFPAQSDEEAGNIASAHQFTTQEQTTAHERLRMMRTLLLAAMTGAGLLMGTTSSNACWDDSYRGHRAYGYGYGPTYAYSYGPRYAYGYASGPTYWYGYGPTYSAYYRDYDYGRRRSVTRVSYSERGDRARVRAGDRVQGMRDTGVARDRGPANAPATRDRGSSGR